VNAQERLLSKVRYENDCWIFTGSHLPTGYGQFWLDGTMRSAHRVSYELHVGKIPDGLQLDHLCRVRSCINPAHLEPVTLQENNRRGRKTHCKYGHLRTDIGKRTVCRECQQIANDSRKERRAS
jgi:hypothetical protein